jgi:hypothetical protein
VHELLAGLLRRSGPLPYSPRGTYLVVHGPSRPAAFPEVATARRRTLELGDPLLGRMTLVATRATTANDGTRHRLVDELVRRCPALILVTDGRQPYQPAELDLVDLATELGRCVFLAVSRAYDANNWPDVVWANQTTLARRFPQLALRSWHLVGRPEPDLADLRGELLDWAKVHAAPPPRRLPAIRVASDAVESNWRDVLRVQVDTACLRAKTCGARELARLRRLADVGQLGIEELGRGLQQLSLTLATEVHLAVDRVVDTVLQRVLAEPPDDRVLERVALSLQRDVAERCGGASACFRALQVTGTAVAAVATSRHAVAGLVAHSDAHRGVLPPLGIGLTANRPAAPDSPGLRERAWVDRAIAAVDAELDRELSRQFTFLGQATADLIADGLDHDLLLV